MTKKEEIKVLRDLCSKDTYFRQFFANDLDQMVDNIEKDFAIENGCTFHIAAASIEEKRKKLQAAARAKVLTIAERLLLVARDNKAAMDILREEIGVLELARLKAKHSIPLTNEEATDLITMAENYFNK